MTAGHAYFIIGSYPQSTPADDSTVLSAKAVYTVTMGGVDITSSVVTGDKTTINCSISNLLTSCNSYNMKPIAIKGQGYVEDINAYSGYEFDTNSIVVTMGGVDITSQVLTLFE